MASETSMLPRIIVLAMGCGVLGGADALRLLLTLAGHGQSPLVDMAICLCFIGMVTAHLLGVVLLARFVRKAPLPGHVGASGEEARSPRGPSADCCLAKTTLTVSAGVAFTVAACLAVVPGGLMSSIRLVPDFIGTSLVAVAVGAAAVAGTVLLVRFCLRPLNAGAGAVQERRVISAVEPRIAALAAGCGVLGGLDALRLLLALAGRSPLADIAICVFFLGMVTAHLLGVVLLVRFVRKAPARVRASGEEARAPPSNCCPLAKMTLMVSLGIAFMVTTCLCHAVAPDFTGTSPAGVRLGVATVAGAVLLARFSVKARNAGAAGAVPAPATGAERFGKLRQNTTLLGVVFFAAAGALSLIQYACSPLQAYKSDGGK